MHSIASSPSDAYLPTSAASTPDADLQGERGLARAVLTLAWNDLRHGSPAIRSSAHHFWSSGDWLVWAEILDLPERVIERRIDAVLRETTPAAWPDQLSLWEGIA